MHSLTPAFMLHEAFGEKVVYSGYAHPETRRWLPPHEWIAAVFSGSFLPIAGDMPVIHINSSVTQETCNLLAYADLPVPRQLISCADSGEIVRAMRAAASGGRRVAINHLFPRDIINDENYCVAPRVLSFLNNKANLGKLVGPPYLPERTVFQCNRMAETLSDFPGRVLKACTDMGSGGGVDVLVPPHSDDPEKAAAFFDCADMVVAEQFYDFVRTACLNFFVHRDGSVRYLGAADQDLSGHYYIGSWLSIDNAVEDHLIDEGRSICAISASMGYMGFIGVDAGWLADGRIIIFDLNFRMNASTVPLMLFPSIIETHGARAGRRISWRGNGLLSELLSVVKKAIDKSLFIPLSLYADNPDSLNGFCNVSGIVTGRNRADIFEQCKTLERNIRHVLKTDQ